MIVICKACGKRYRLNSSKIQNDKATATCTSCYSKITVYHPEHMDHRVLDRMPVHAPDHAPTLIIGGTFLSKLPIMAKNRRYETENGKTEAPASHASEAIGNRRIFGLREKIFLLFFIIPISLIIFSGYLLMGQLDNLSSLISDESIKVVTQMAEQIIIQKGRDVARETQNYLDAHPDLKKEEFNTTPEFLAVAMQKVGETGYTLLAERETLNKPEIVWVHPDAKLVGIDITGAMKQRLGDKWERWDNARARSYETKGYYTWFDNREKFCACIPIGGTPFNIVSSTYIDEFTKPMMALQQKAGLITTQTQRFVLWIILGAALLVASITLFYGHRLTNKIRGLTQITDRISVGEMDIDIVVNDKDELGDLAQAISRMQDSIRLSIKRLRNRRARQVTFMENRHA
jgi:HAMP domain-containing protein